MRTGRDLAIASLLGADEFGFATSALISLGCTMLRHCHLNNCSLGVATQDERCAARFTGKSEYVENFMRFTARHLREIMAQLGFRYLDEMRGRSDLLQSCAQSRSISGLDFSALFDQVQNPYKSYHFPQENTLDLCQDFDKKLIDLTKDIVRTEQSVQQKIVLDLPISNTDRAAGTMLSGHIMSKRGEEALPEDSITLNLTGTAGQSFGAWLCKGITMKLSGIANDYVGKGLFGGTIAVKRAGTGAQTAEPYALAGNTVLYGAVSGELYIAGSAGERFCVRNSGAHAVVEGIGDHGCEYMTGGSAIILGKTGRNFAAGMSGGIAYIYDPQKEFHKKFNNELADCEPLNEKDYEFISKQLQKHHLLTQSNKADEILKLFSTHKNHFVKVLPRDYRAYLVKKGLL
jgi:glutamate synthase domain-containing protein 3